MTLKTRLKENEEVRPFDIYSSHLVLSLLGKTLVHSDVALWLGTPGNKEDPLSASCMSLQHPGISDSVSHRLIRCPKTLHRIPVCPPCALPGRMVSHGHSPAVLKAEQTLQFTSSAECVLRDGSRRVRFLSCTQTRFPRLELIRTQ